MAHDADASAETMSTPPSEPWLAELAELAERDPGDPELARWLAEHPEAAADLELARRVRLLLAELRAAEFAVPEGFEARLWARLHQEVALRNLLNLSLSGVGSLLLELIALVFGLLPTSPEPAPA